MSRRDPADATPDEILGRAYEKRLGKAARRARGAHFTPRELARTVIDRALDALGPRGARAPTVLDPTMGGGAFLCEALRTLVAREASADTPAVRRRLALERLFGVDKDPGAVAVARKSLWLAIGDESLDPRALEQNLIVGDALFDARLRERTFTLVLGNPPFLGGKRIRTIHGDAYADALARLHPPANKNTDIAAHFLRRAFDLLEPGGVVGFVVTNTIAQGDTREGGLAEIVRRGGVIVGATRRLPWPGDAGVVVSLVWVKRGEATGQPLLDDRPVGVIDAFLSPHGRVAEPRRLPENAGRAFIGCFLRGKGFVFDDAASGAVPLAEMRRVLDASPRSAEVVLPFLGGEEVLSHPEQKPHRWVIHFGARSLEDVRARFPELTAIVEARVRPFREARRETKADAAHAAAWWRFANTRPELEAKKRGLSRVIVLPRMTSNVVAAFLSADYVPSDQLVVVASESAAVLGVLSSRVHAAWARLLASTLGDGLRYTPTDVFETFPFPCGGFVSLERDPSLRRAGERFHEARARSLLELNAGITALLTMARRADPAPAVRRFIRAQRELDRAVLDAYGWSDLVDRDGQAFDDAVLARLFAENARLAERGGRGRARPSRCVRGAAPRSSRPDKPSSRRRATS